LPPQPATRNTRLQTASPRGMSFFIFGSDAGQPGASIGESTSVGTRVHANPTPASSKRTHCFQQT
jgi:hypothetical protein